MTLIQLFTNIANAIRSKKGTTAGIKAEDFASEITNLPSGGAISQEEYDIALDTTNNILNGSVGYDWAKRIKQVQYLFSDSSFTEIDMNGFNDENIENMLSMFSSCSKLIKIDLSMLNGKKVLVGQNMFSYCNVIEEINLSNMTFERMFNAIGMFNHCIKLQKLNIKNFNPKALRNYSGMFTDVPTTVEIITNQTMANWLTTNFPAYTNITIVTADWEV